MKSAKYVMYAYSLTGNSMAAAKRAAARLSQDRQQPVEVIDLLEQPQADRKLSSDDVVGLFFPVYHLSVPPDLVKRLPKNWNEASVFCVATFGVMAGKSIRHIWQESRNRNARWIGGYRFPCPESFPPFIVKGYTNPEWPNKDHLREFDSFIDQITELKTVQKPSLTVWDRIIPAGNLKSGRKKMGELQINGEKCTRCGECVRSCPVKALETDSSADSSGLPVWNRENCLACWRCYNSCSVQAVTCSGLKGEGHYSGFPKTHMVHTPRQ